MAYTINDFAKDINEILAICQKELSALEAGEKRQATKEQIENTIIPEMRDLLEKIKTGNLPEKGSRWLLSEAYITRGWNWDEQSDEELNHKLPALDYKYRYELN